MDTEGSNSGMFFIYFYLLLFQLIVINIIILIFYDIEFPMQKFKHVVIIVSSKN